MNRQTTQEWEFETLNVSADGAVLLVEITAPHMNLLGPELVRDLPQNMSGQYGARCQPKAVVAAATAPGVCSVTRAARCRCVRGTPPR